MISKVFDENIWYLLYRRKGKLLINAIKMVSAGGSIGAKKLTHEFEFPYFRERCIYIFTYILYL